MPSSSLIPKIIPIPNQAFTSLRDAVAEFQAAMPSDMEIGISVSGTDNIIHVAHIKLASMMVVFGGVDSQGRQAQVIQHYTQINVQLVAVPPIGARHHASNGS